MGTARAQVSTGFQRKGCKRVVYGNRSGAKISSSNVRMMETMALARMMVYREEDDNMIAFNSLSCIFVRFI